MIDTLITALSKELELAAEEIADTIWLALQIQESQSESTATQKLKNDLSQSSLKSKELEGETLPETKTKTSDSGETASKQSPEEPKAGIYPRNPQETLFKSKLSFKVPDAPSLREPLTLARALKPLMRRIPSGTTLVLDESATTQRIANEGLWLPVLRPTLEPWLDLELVVDEGISMQIWRHTIRELERLLKNYGIFRDVRVWGLITDNLEQVQIRRGIGATAKNQSPRSPAELIDPSARRLVLVVSDCVSSLWRDGKVTTTLEIWAKQGSMAIVQMLPKWLWKRTALGRASEVRLQGLNPGELNHKLIAKEVSLWDELEETRGVKVPVFTLEPDKVATWAQMLSGKGGIWTPGYVFKLEPVPVNKRRELFNLNSSQESAEQRVQAFRVTASPMARKLAGLLAAAPMISLPIVRLIQRTLLKESQQVHVAEVFLGGLLRPLSEINAETNPDYVQYEFMDGVRELLVDSVPSEYVMSVVDEVSKDVAKKMGLSLEDFAAVLKNPQQVRDSQIAGDVGYFATVTAQVLRRLGGEYGKYADELVSYNPQHYIIKKIYNCFNLLSPLPPGDPAYVDFKDVRGDYDILDDLGIKIKLSRRNTYQLCTGHRGAGCSTELLRLKNNLEQRGFFVIYFAADEEDIDISDVEYIDILLACTRHILEALQEYSNPQYLLTLLKEILQNSEELRLLYDTEPELKISQLTNLIASIIRTPSLRTTIRSVLQPYIPSLIDALNQFIKEAKKQKIYNHDTTLVLLIDHLQRIAPISENIFIDYHEQLTALDCHIVYTIPLYLIYSNEAAILNSIYSSSIFVLPLIMIQKPDGSIYQSGINKLIEIINNRILLTDVNLSLETEIFENHEIIEQLCLMSGGHIRELFQLICNALSKVDSLPISQKAVQYSIANLKSNYRRVIDGDDWSTLAEVYCSKKIVNDDRYRRLLFGRYIREYFYINEEGEVMIWYDVPPIIIKIPEFQEAFEYLKQIINRVKNGQQSEEDMTFLGYGWRAYEHINLPGVSVDESSPAEN